MDARIQHCWRTEELVNSTPSLYLATLVRCTLPVGGVSVLEIFQKLVVVVNLKGVTGSMHLVIPAIFFAFIGGDASVECHFSNIYVENVRIYVYSATAFQIL